MTTVQMRTIDGVKDAHKREEREFRPVPGLENELAITRGGLAKLIVDEEITDADDWPHLLMAIDRQLMRADLRVATALAWTTPEERAAVRARLAPGITHRSPGVMEVVAELNISKHAVQVIAQRTEEDLQVLSPLPGVSADEGEVFDVIDARIESYGKLLYEYSRPPSRGGNTSALHVHSVMIDGERYSWFGRGSQQWIHKSDLVSFRYVLTPEGHRNVIRTTIKTRDAKTGEITRRGNRGAKTKLRSVPTRLPVSRREARD